MNIIDCHGALLRAGIQRPTVTITADDPRLLRGKPFPDPFLLAAKELGYAIEKCLVFEDSPSGIKAGVVSGAKTIAVCTSHPGKFQLRAIPCSYPITVFVTFTDFVLLKSRKSMIVEHITSSLPSTAFTPTKIKTVPFESVSFSQPIITVRSVV